MSNLKLSKKEIAATKETIEHWKIDIQCRLKRGEKIRGLFFALLWKKSGKAVKCTSNFCTLCKISTDVTKRVNCTICPFYKKYGKECMQREWSAFIRNPCLRTCNAMIKALEGILK